MATLSARGEDPDDRPRRQSGSKDDATPTAPRQLNWLAMGSLAFGSIAALSAVRFFPGALLTAVIGGWLGERALESIREDPSVSGRGVAWWGIVSSAVAFAIALFVAIQAQAVLTDPELLREALERMEATPSP